MGTLSILHQLLQQALAAFEDIAPGGFEIACIPGVGYITDTVSEVNLSFNLICND